MRGFQKNLNELSQLGIQPVAISVDSPELSSNLRTKAGLTYSILSDASAETTRRYELLHAGGGPEKQDISRPAEFLVDRSGTIRWENFTDDVRVRARAEQIMEVAKTLE